jgi:hypothetical protein
LRSGAWEGKQLFSTAWTDKIIHATVDMHNRWEPDLRYSNFFWVLPDKRVYMAAGYNGQVIMVLPDLDVVAVTTARDSHNFGESAGFISRSVKSDTALPADTAGAKLLADKISDASTEKPTGSQMASIISGKVYRFSRNKMNLKSLSVVLTDPHPRYEVEAYATDATQSDPRFTGPIGLDGLYRKGEPTRHGLAGWFEGVPRVNAVKGSWQDNHTFVIDRLVIGTGSLQSDGRSHSTETNSTSVLNSMTGPKWLPKVKRVDKAFLLFLIRADGIHPGFVDPRRLLTRLARFSALFRTLGQLMG